MTDGHQCSNCKESNLNTKRMMSAARLTFAMLSIAVMPLASSVAAPPGGGISPPPVIDVAYMNGQQQHVVDSTRGASRPDGHRTDDVARRGSRRASILHR